MMTSKDVIELCKEYGFNRVTNQTLFRWRRGWYIHPTTRKKVWYLKNKATLPFESVSMGKGYSYDRYAVLAYIHELDSERKKNANLK